MLCNHPPFPFIFMKPQRKRPQSNLNYLSLSNEDKLTTVRANGNQSSGRTGSGRHWITKTFQDRRQSARHLVTAFLVSMPITDEITSGDGCFCVEENASITLRRNGIKIRVRTTIKTRSCLTELSSSDTVNIYKYNLDSNEVGTLCKT